MLSGVRRAARARFGTSFIFVVAAGAVFYWLFIWRLGSLTPGLSTDESIQGTSSLRLSEIINNPVYLPHKLLQFGLQSALHGSHVGLRLTSVIFAAIFLICFYSLASRWFGKLIGLVASLMFAATPWIITIGRSATPEIMLLAPLIIVVSFHWLSHTTRWMDLAWIVFVIVCALSLYIPGLFWLMLAATIFERKMIWFNLKKIKPTPRALGLIIFLLVLAPLFYALAKQPSLAKQPLLIPSTWPTVIEAVKSIVWNFSSLFIKSRDHFQWLVGRTAILSISELVLLIFGVYAMAQMARRKLYVMMLVVIYAIIIASLNSSLSYLSLALPALLILVAAGLRFLYLEWHSVFPRNPIPKYFAYGLIIGLAILQLSYGSRYALQAWPNLSSTKSVYVIK